ncbi:hypothetical protein RVBP21_2440 [Pseudomonas phage BRkr]|nr:hypothetical protein RVBP21_2440 [Pseudomonas phage BRkr]
MSTLVHKYVAFTRTFKLTEIEMPKGDRMVRVGGGFNKGKGFFRVDLGALGYRITRRNK